MDEIMNFFPLNMLQVWWNQYRDPLNYMLMVLRLVQSLQVQLPGLPLYDSLSVLNHYPYVLIHFSSLLKYCIGSTPVYLSIMFFFTISDPGQTAQSVAIVGGEAFLPCNTTAPGRSHPPLLVIWYKNGGGDPVYR